MEKELKELFCQWCPNDCQDREKDKLTDEERAGCVASGGFAQAAVDLPVNSRDTLGGVTKLAVEGHLLECDDNGELLRRFLPVTP